MSKKLWQKAIVKALRDKGFTKNGARKTAKMTIQKSVAKRELDHSIRRVFTLKTMVIDGQTVNVKVYPPVTK